MKCFRVFLLYSLLFLIYPLHNYAQVTALRFENFTTENGLPQNSGYSIAQTAEGFMWFGTQDGLCRFDGYRLKIYKHIQNDSLSICGNQVNTLFTDYKGNLWIGTPNGVCIYLFHTDQFTSPAAYLGYACEADKLNTQFIMEDSDKNIWVVTANQGLYLLNNHDKKTSRFFTENPDKLSLGEIKKDEQQRICITNGNDIYRFNGVDFTALQIKNTKGFPRDGLTISHFLFTNKELWLASLNHGLIRINSSTNKVIEKIDSRNKTWQLKNNEITDLLRDSKNNIWIGTVNNGIYKYDFTNGQLANGCFIASDKYSIRKNYIISLFEDKQGITWIGTSGGGIAKYDPDKFFFHQVLLTDQLGNQAPDNMIMGLLHIPGKGFIAGTQSGGIIEADSAFGNLTFFKNNPTYKQTLFHDNVYQMLHEKGLTWMATWGGLYSYNIEKGIFNRHKEIADNVHSKFYSIAGITEENTLFLSGTKGLFAFNMLENKWQTCNDKAKYLENRVINGRYMWREPGKTIIWICTEGEGLLEYDYKEGTFRNFPLLTKNHKTIRHLYKNKNMLWLASDQGLIVLDEISESIKKIYDKRHGLPGDVIYAILPDKKGNLWLSTNNGISCFDIQKEVFKNYNESNGLQSAEFNTASCCSDEKGRLFFGGINGINYFLPTDITYNSYITPTLITGISVMNKPFTANGNASYLKKIELPYNQNFISIEYSNPNFSHTANNSYVYMLKGIDKDWVDAGKSTVATYTNLPPGKYLFQVKAANNEGSWNKEATTMTIIIKPPYWATWWFRSLYISLLAVLLMLYVSQRIKNIRRRAELDKQLSTYEMKALHAQMNPHFIFNCLNSIKDMILQGENKNASRYLSSFAQLIRETLEHSKHTFISLQESITHLERYIEMEKIRFENFSYHLEIDKNINLNEIMVPPMLLQPLVENAIWHGLRQNQGEKTLNIIIRKSNNNICCIIEDNGPGINHSKDIRQINKEIESTAINNIYKRISLLNEKFNMDYSITITDKSTDEKYKEKGTVAEIIIPLKSRNYKN